MPMNNNRYSFFFHESKYKRGTMVRKSLLICAFALLPLLADGQASTGDRRLTDGLILFKQEQYLEAIQKFRELISDPSAPESTGDAYYWIARSYLAVNVLEEAERNLEYFLSNYPSNSNYPDALYQKGRLLYLQGEPPSAIQVLEGFVSDYPYSDFVGSAYFWIGESLFSLGRLDEAARMFNKVIQEYPRSVKLEASRYRLSLIEFKKREDELLKLLKWSHEEALKSVEEFQRREKAYEQAISVYQRKLSALAQKADQAGGERSTEIERLSRENSELKERIAALEAQLETLSAEASTQAGVTSEQLESFERRQKALRLKEESLAVKESLLRALAESTGRQ
jgi:TolA-binding protein